MTGRAQERSSTAAVMAVLVLALTASGCGLWKKTAVPKTVWEPEPLAGVGGYSIQFGLFDTQKEAEETATKVTELTGDTPDVIYKPPFYRVHIIQDGDEATVDRKVEEFQALGFESARRVFTYDQK